MILNSFERMGSELFQHGNTDINYIKYEDIPVEAISENVPSHINTFDDDEFKLEKYDVFTPVQKNAIPIIMSECDVMACPGQFWKDCRVPGPDPL